MIKIFLSKKNIIYLFLIFLTLFSILFSIIVIKDFSQPLIGFGDEDYWDYEGFYFAKNLSWLPFPHLNLNNNQTFYPYGTNNIFQPWSVERDLLHAGFYSLFGFGPWLKIYYLTTVIVTALGAFLLLFRDYGVARASGACFLVSFFNFYAIHKYPGHLNLAVIHWTVLSFITDFLILKKVVFQQPVSLRLILVRGLLLILSMGQELGYIAGFALMSFTVSSCFIFLILFYRDFKNQHNFINFINQFKFLLEKYKIEFSIHRTTSLALLAFCAVTAYAYLPLVLQIVIEAKSFDFTGVPSGAWWVNPYRLLIPFLPGLNPGMPFDVVFQDSSEGLGAGSPGWLLLILGTLGLWQTRNKFVIFIPLITIFILCLFYHPADFPTLKIFPWFTFNRVAGRVTVIYPVILTIFALEIHFYNLKLQTQRLVVSSLICLACLELYTSYSFKESYQSHLLDKNFFKYMEYVRNQTGEAVLDWPFCIAGGNGVGQIQGLCPYFWKNSSIFALRRFHDKKVVGQYFGRLHPSQLKPYLQAGWNQLFSPNNPDFTKATQQTQCFSAEEWSFFTDFYQFNDFAGINLYTDLLPESCAQEFYARFGNPTIETRILGAGKVRFIPKSAELRSKVNLALGSKIKFEPSLDFSETNLLKTSSQSSFMSILGLSYIEENTQINWRWALGPETNIVFKLNDSQLFDLSFKFDNPIEGQNVVVEVNGVTVKSFNNLIKNASVDSHLRLQASTSKGINRVVFKYKYWNSNQTRFAPNDYREMSVLFTRLLIQPATD